MFAHFSKRSANNVALSQLSMRSRDNMRDFHTVASSSYRCQGGGYGTHEEGKGSESPVEKKMRKLPGSPTSRTVSFSNGSLFALDTVPKSIAFRLMECFPCSLRISTYGIPNNYSKKNYNFL